MRNGLKKGYFLFLSKESQDACHNGCPIRFRLDAFKRKAQYKSAVVPFVGNTCTLIAGCIRKYGEGSIYGNNTIGSRYSITAFIRQTWDCNSTSLIL